MKIVSSSPNKIHLAGEHSVVYGGKSLLAPVEVNGKRVRVSVESKQAKLAFFEYSSPWGKAFFENEGAFQGEYGEH